MLSRTLVPPEHTRMVASIVLALCCVLTLSSELGAQRGKGDLDGRVQAFIAAVDTLGPDGLVSFFPRSGIFTYRRTVYTPEGRRLGTWRFSASDVRAALEGPLSSSFDIQIESQPIGLFEHQVKMRSGEWHRVNGNRFVPPGADASSAIYIEWRIEGANWVISEFGDEVYTTGVALPRWCC